MAPFEIKSSVFVNKFSATSAKGYEPAINDCLSLGDVKPSGWMSSLPDCVMKRLPDPKVAITPEGIDLGRRVVFIHDDMGELLNKEYEGVMQFLTTRKLEMTFPGYAMPWLDGGKPVVAEAFGDLATAEHDKAWINALNVAARFFGGARPEQYNATDARSVAYLADLKTSPFRLLTRLANLYLSAFLAELGVIKIKGGWINGVEVQNVNNPTRHGQLLESASVNNRDIIWAPNDITDMRRVVAILGAASAGEYPYSDNSVLASLWPALNRPFVAYCARMDAHQHLEDYVFNSAEVMLVANMVCHHFGWTDQWKEALQLAGFYATHSERFGACMGQNRFMQRMPPSDLRALGLGPMITAKGGTYYEAPAWQRPEYLLLEGAVRRLLLNTCEAAAVEAMGFQYSELGLAQSLMRSLSLRSQVYDQGSVCGNIAQAIAADAGWPDINKGVLCFRGVDPAATELQKCVMWNRYPSWHFMATLGFSYPEGSDADVLHSLARITDMELASNEWHQVSCKNTSSLKAVMALQLMGGDFMYEVRSIGRRLDHVPVQLSTELDGSYIPTLPLKAHKLSRKADLLFKPKRPHEVLLWNVKAKQYDDSAKFVIPNYAEYNLLDDWYGQFDAPQKVVEDIAAGKRALLALPSVARMEALTASIRPFFPEVADELAKLGNARGRDAAEDEVFGMAKFIVSSKFTQEDLLDRIKEFPMADRAAAADAARKTSALLKDCLENAQERILAIQSEDLAAAVHAAMDRCPAFSFDEYREWAKQEGSILAKVSWPQVPDELQSRMAIKEGAGLTDWLLRNNPHFDPKKAPHSVSAAKKQQSKLTQRSAEAKERLAGKLKTTASASTSAGPATEQADTAEDNKPGQEDFPSATSSEENPSPAAGSALVEGQPISTPRIEFGEAEASTGHGN
jgi:nitrogen fixation-related uncharacterized protein